MAYDENSIKTLDWREHIRMRPGMYIGKLGDGASPDDGIYVLLKEVIDNSIDEFVMGFGKKITIDVTPDGLCEVRDFGRGIPLGKLLDCAAKINTGAKYDSDAFKKSVGLNGVGIKAVNALSDFFEIQAYRDGETRSYQFCRGKEIPKGRKDGATDPTAPARLSTRTRISFQRPRNSGRSISKKCADTTPTSTKGWPCISTAAATSPKTGCWTCLRKR